MRRLTQEDFEGRVYRLYSDISILGQYHNLNTKIEIKCMLLDDIGREHGVYTTKADSLLNQGKGCKKCANDIRSLAQTRFTHSKNFFTTPNIVNCYWAGFIAADGCIVDARHLVVLLKRDDVGHLQQFCRDIEYDGNIYYGSSTLKGREYGRCQIEISNAEKIIHDLNVNFAIHKQKSLTYTHPELQGDLALAFLKGYIDGDGHIDVEKRKRLSVCGTRETLTWIKTIFDEYSPARSSNGLIADVRQQGNIFAYEIGGQRAIKMLEILAAVPCPALPRKWDKLVG